MGMMLPPELAGALNTVGFNWPQSDESKLLDMGHHWLGFGPHLSGPLDDVDHHAGRVWTEHSGQSVDAFRADWAQADHPTTNLRNATHATGLVGAGLFVCTGVVVALKINVAIQLVMFLIEAAEAVAEAFATFGASLLELPILRELTKILLDQLQNLALNAVLGG
jgi:hypothetical protein